MPHHKSAAKRMRTSERDRKKNVAVRSAVRKATRTVRTDAKAGDGSEAPARRAVPPRQRRPQGCHPQEDRRPEEEPAREAGQQVEAQDGLASVQAQQVAPFIPTGALAQKAAQGLDASHGECRPVLHAVNELEGLTPPPEQDSVLSHHVADAQRMHADLLAIAGSGVSLPAMDEAAAPGLPPDLSPIAGPFRSARPACRHGGSSAISICHSRGRRFAASRSAARATESPC